MTSSAPSDLTSAILAVDVVAMTCRRAVQAADFTWQQVLNGIFSDLSGVKGDATISHDVEPDLPHTIAAIQETLRGLPPLTLDRNGNDGAQITLEEILLA
jgi:hypothetical protein